MTSWAWPTHYYPMVPLGWALRAAGHQVRVASQPALLSAISRSGHTGVSVGRDINYDGIAQEANGTAERQRSAAGRPGPEELRAIVLDAFRVFERFASAMVDELVEYARHWRPDVIVYEPTTYAAPIAAAVIGVPAVRYLWGIDYTCRARPYEPELLADLCARFGLDQVETLGDLTIDPCPPELQVAADCPRQLVRYVPYNGPGALPRWLIDPPARPRVCLTWGTSSIRLGSHLFIAPEVLEAIDDPGVEIVAAVSKGCRDRLPADRPNVRVVENLPLHLLLPSCDLIVHQGGMGTAMTAVTQGVPQIVVPQLTDQVFNARKLAETGAAAMVTRDRVAEPRALRDLVGEMLAGSTYRQNAGRLAAALNGQPSLDVAAERIARLAGDRAAIDPRTRYEAAT